MVYLIAAIAMTMSILVIPPLQAFVLCKICAPVDKISTDKPRRAVPLQ